MRVPCDLDLAAAEDRAEAEHLFAEQAGALRDALVGADTVLDIWREPLEDLAHDHIRVDRRISLNLRLPAHRLLPTALVAPEKQIVVTAVCSARSLGEGRPPMGIAVRPAGRRARVSAPRRPRALPGRLPRGRRRARHERSPSSSGRQEASVQRFLELNGRRFPIRPAYETPRPLRRTRVLIVVGFALFFFLGDQRDAGPRAGRDRAPSAAACSRSPRRRRAGTPARS